MYVAVLVRSLHLHRWRPADGRVAISFPSVALLIWRSEVAVVVPSLAWTVQRGRFDCGMCRAAVSGNAVDNVNKAALAY